MRVKETIIARGHKNIKATHSSTIEITRDSWLSEKGDCIVAVSASKSVADLTPRFKRALCNHHAKVTVLLTAGGLSDVVTAFGSPELTLTHPADMVIRKSKYVCPRTLAVNADKAASDLSKQLLEMMKSGHHKIVVHLTVES